MILRVFRALIKPGKVDQFRDMLVRLSIPMVKAARGMRGYYVGEPLDPAVPEFTVTTLWEDLDALKAFAGDDWNRSVIPPDEVPLIAESFIHHYEILASDWVPALDASKGQIPTGRTSAVAPAQTVTR